MKNVNTNGLTVSVVVPVYNVEKYLVKCLESLINQTYSNMEIILVDDGSTDKSGDICNIYASKYGNIKVLHKKNGGLSDARNYAIPYICGQYVSYVDSDDYVELNYISHMVDILIKENADLVATGYVDESEDGVCLTKHKFSNMSVSMNSEQAIGRMCYQNGFGTSAWGKLVPIEFVKKYTFPTNKIYEDLATMYKMVGESKKIVYVDCATYHYVQREGSIRHAKWSDKIMDVMDATSNLLQYIYDNYPNCTMAGIYRYYFSANEVYVRAFKEKNYLQIIKPIRVKLIRMWKAIKNNHNITLVQKAKYYLMTFYPLVYRMLWRIIKR